MIWFLRSIRAKLTISILTAVIILLSVLLIMSYTFLKDYSLTNALELSETILNDTDSQISRFFLEVEYLADSLKRHSAVYTGNINAMRELIITTVYARREYLRAIYLGTKEGEMYEWGYGEGFKDNTPTFPPGYDPRVRPWYRAALESPGFAVSEPYIYASIHALGITCVTPVTDSKNNFIGVLGLDIILKGLENLINDLNVEKNGKIILLNKNHEILASQFGGYEENITTLESFSKPEILKSPDGYVISELEGEKMLITFKENAPTGWILLLALPYASIMEFSSWTLSIILLSEIVLVFILASVIVILLHNIVTDPLGKMITVLREIENGNYSARISIRGNDEFAVLGRMFNQLEDIRTAYTEEMEKEIVKRTEVITGLQKENTRLRIIEEKERIFGNLHDSLGARLTNIFISNSVAKKAAASNQAMLKEMLEKIEKNTKMGIQDLKEIIFGPETGDRVIMDFSRLLEFNIRERLKLRKTELEFNCENRDTINSLSSSLRFETEKLLQEIISNILKHSEASLVELNIRTNDKLLEIEIKDNGKGFDMQKISSSGFGITSIIHRVERLGGYVNLDTAPGSGVFYQIFIPQQTEGSR